MPFAFCDVTSRPACHGGTGSDETHEAVPALCEGASRKRIVSIDANDI